MSNEIIGIISAVTGLVGAAGGVTISYLTLRHAYRKDRYIIKLELAESILMFPEAGTTKLKPSKNMLTFRVANVGLKEFTVTQIGLEIGKRSGGLVIPVPVGTVTLPYVLKPGESCNFWTEVTKIEESIKKMIPKYHLYKRVKVRAYVRDYIGNSISSNRHTFVLKESKIRNFFSKIKKVTRKVTAIIVP